MFFTFLADTTTFADNATRALSVAANGTVVSTVPAATNATVSAVANATLPAVAHATGIAENLAGTVPPPVTFSWFGYFEAISVMFLLLGALWGVLWIIRRYGKFRFLPAPGNFPRNGLRIEAQLALGPRRGLYVIHYLGERLLIGVTEQQITLLQEARWADGAFADGEGSEKITHDHPDAQRFARLLQQERDTGATP